MSEWGLTVRLLARWLLASLLCVCMSAYAVIPEGSVERCNNSNQTLANAPSIQTKEGRLYILVEGTVSGGSIMAHHYRAVGGGNFTFKCHPADSSWAITNGVTYTTGTQGTFTAYEVGFLQDVVGADAWGASKAIQIMGWFLAPLLFGSGFLVGRGT